MRRLAQVLLLASLTAQAAGDKPAYLVIVSPENPLTTVDRKFVAAAFLKKATRWPDQTLIRPVDLGASSPVREKFTTGVLERSVSAVKSYWEQSIFAGRDTPPPELDSDEAVLKFVMKHPGAVGYVSGAADVSQVKVVSLK